jgi:NAD(P)-dependent dehydrogenase (short-subunit alcohol dehydrogenase family)
MKLTDRRIVITGAASGIGAALALRFAAERPRALVLADLPAQSGALDALAARLNSGEAGRPAVPAMAFACDVGDEAQVQALVAATEERFGPIDVFCSNAGLIRDGDEFSPDAHWTLNWQVHVMAHVYAARAVVPNPTPVPNSES